MNSAAPEMSTCGRYPHVLHPAHACAPVKKPEPVEYEYEAWFGFDPKDPMSTYRSYGAAWPKGTPRPAMLP